MAISGWQSLALGLRNPLSLSPPSAGARLRPTPRSPARSDGLGWIDDAGLAKIDEFLARGIEADIDLTAEHSRNHHAAAVAEFSAIWRAGASSARLRICTPVLSSPSLAASSLLTASTHLRSASPPTGTMPSATAALVELMASSSASFLAFISASVGAPTRITATPPDILASRSSSFSLS